MKKIILALATLTLCLSTTVYASANNYVAQKSATSIKPLVHPPTDITVVNATNNMIYVVTPIGDYVEPGYNLHIHGEDPYSYSTFISLQDQYHNSIYSAYVCRLAIVTISGSSGSYRVNTDSDLCD